MYRCGQDCNYRIGHREEGKHKLIDAKFHRFFLVAVSKGQFHLLIFCLLPWH